jgi:hypothetical protein
LQQLHCQTLPSKSTAGIDDFTATASCHTGAEPAFTNALDSGRTIGRLHNSFLLLLKFKSKEQLEKTDLALKSTLFFGYKKQILNLSARIFYKKINPGLIKSIK